MRKDNPTSTIIFVLITMALNVLAPILMIDMYKDYTAKSFIIGTPDKVVQIENLDVNNYVFQENLSKMNFVSNGNENEYVFNYYFEAKDFNSTENNYLIYVNDYMLSITNLESKAISGTHTRYFIDANNEVCNEVDIEVTFEFYSTYSYLLVKLTTPDMSYLNGFRENPGLVLTLSKVDYGMLGNLDNYKEVVTLQQELKDLQDTYNSLQSSYNSLQQQYNQSNSNNTALEAQISQLENTITNLNNQITDLQARLDAYDKDNKHEITFQSKGVTQDVLLIDKTISNLTLEQIPTLEHTQSSHFSGWSLDGETVVDPTTVEITSNTTFIAVWITIVGTWSVNDDCFDGGYIYEADKTVVITEESVIATYNDGTEFSMTDKYAENIYFGQFQFGNEYMIYAYNGETDTLHIFYNGSGYSDMMEYVDFDDLSVIATRVN